MHYSASRGAVCLMGIAAVTGCTPMALIAQVDHHLPRGVLVACNETDRSFSLRVNGHGLLALPAGTCRHARLLLGGNVLWPGESATSREWFIDNAWIISVPEPGTKLVFRGVGNRVEMASVVGLQSRAPALGLRCQNPADTGRGDNRPYSARRDVVLRWTRAYMACQRIGT